MGVSVPLKLKDSAGLQSIDSDNYDFLAYRTGLQLVGLDSDDPLGFGTRVVSAPKRLIGQIQDTSYDSATGTHGPDALFSTTTTTSYLYQGTETLDYTDSNYRNFLYQTDSALDSGSQLQLKAFNDSDWKVFNNEIVSRMVKKDYPGVIYLGDSDFDSANGSWSKIITNFYSDTRTSGDAVNYHIWQKQYLTDSVPSDSAKPFTMKYRADSAEVNISGKLLRIGEDSGKKTEFAYPPSSGIESYLGGDRILLGFGASNVKDSIDPHLILSQEWLDKLFGQYKNVNYGKDNNDGFIADRKIRTDYLILRDKGNNADALERSLRNPSVVWVVKDSDDRMARQSWFGIKGRVNLVDSARFGGLDATFAATDTVMQKHVESDGKFSFVWLFDSDTEVIPSRQDPFDGATKRTPAWYNSEFTVDSNGVSNYDSAPDAFFTAGRNIVTFGSSNGVPRADSATSEMLKRLEFNNRFQGDFTRLLHDSSFSDAIGADSDDEVYLILKNDFQGLQIADSDQLNETLSRRARNHITTVEQFENPPIGSYQLRSSADGTPTQAGILGTWESKGIATDFRNAIDEVNYTRTRTSSYTRTRASSFSADYSQSYNTVRTSSYTDGFLGNYLSDFTRVRASNFDRTRTSSYAINYQGNFFGNFTGIATDNSLAVISSQSFVHPSTASTTATFSLTIPSNCKSIVVSGGVGTNGNRRTRFSTMDVSGTGNLALTECQSVNNTLGEYTFDSAIFARNIYSTGSRTLTVTFTNNPQVYGAGINVLYLNKYFKNNSPLTAYSWVSLYDVTTTIGSQSGVGNTPSLRHYYGGLTVATATIYDAPNHSAGIGILSGGQVSPYSNNTPLTHTGNRDSIHGWQVHSGTPNGQYVTVNPAARRFANDNGETGLWFSFSPTGFSDLTTDYVGAFTRTSSRNFSRDFSGNYTGNFTGNYTGEFTRASTAFYSRDFAGNYTGQFARNFAGDYVGNYSRNFAGNFTGNFVTNYTRTSTKSLNYTDYGRNPLAPGGSDEAYWRVGTGPGAYIEIYLASNSDPDLPGSIDSVTNLSGYFSQTVIYYDDAYNIWSDSASSMISSNYYTFTRGTFRGADGGFNYYSLRVNRPNLSFTGNYAATNYTRVSTRTSSRTFSATYQRTRASNYTRDFTRVRTSSYSASASFSRDFAGEYIGNYTGNYSRDFLGNYSRDFAGDYLGDTISTNKASTAHETYTLYVRTD